MSQLVRVTRYKVSNSQVKIRDSISSKKKPSFKMEGTSGRSVPSVLGSLRFRLMSLVVSNVIKAIQGFLGAFRKG